MKVCKDSGELGIRGKREKRGKRGKIKLKQWKSVIIWRRENSFRSLEKEDRYTVVKCM